MTWNRFASQLRREIKANPGKAALLGGLLLVALYYWIPLVGKWVSGSKGMELVRAKATAGESLALSGENAFPALSGGIQNLTLGREVPLSPGSGKAQEAPPRWDLLVQWRQADPRTQPAQGPSVPRDPFQPLPRSNLSESTAWAENSPKAKTGRNTRSSSPSESLLREEPPEQVEVELTSIVVGPTRRVALINGRTYQEGNTLLVTKDGQQWLFRLSRILPTGIQLQWNDRQYEVPLPRSLSNVEIQMVFTNQPENP